MTTYIATIQEGHAAESLQRELTSELANIATESFGDESEVKWKVIPKGFGWTAGRPSNSSIILCVVPEDLEFKTRANFMSRINEMWVDKTSSDPNELLIFTQGKTL